MIFIFQMMIVRIFQDNISFNDPDDCLYYKRKN